MAEIIDVAEAVLDRVGVITSWKLQKLCFYAQAWHLVWEDHCLFGSKFYAWPNGPVAPDLFRHHRGLFMVSPGFTGGDGTRLSTRESTSVDAVVQHYGAMDSVALTDLGHNELWGITRTGLDPLEIGEVEIATSAMADFYRALSQRLVSV